MNRSLLTHGIFIVTVVTGCAGTAGIAPPPEIPAIRANVVSLATDQWFVYYSNGVPPHPSRFGDGWTLDLPRSADDGHVNYVQTPFNATTLMHYVSVTFKIDSASPEYHVTDSTDILPATMHLFIEKKGDDLRDPNGRWWASHGYTLDPKDSETMSITVQFTPDFWSNVLGQQDSASFHDALENIAWIGFTLGGQYFFGHGVSVASGSAKLVLVGFDVN